MIEKTKLSNGFYVVIYKSVTLLNISNFYYYFFVVLFVFISSLCGGLNKVNQSINLFS